MCIHPFQWKTLYRDLHNYRPLKLVMSCQIWKVWWQDGLPLEREDIAPVLKIVRFRCWTMLVKTTRKTFRKKTICTSPYLKLLLYYFDRLSVVWHDVKFKRGPIIVQISVCLTCSTGHATVTSEILTAVLSVEFPIISTCKKASLRVLVHCTKYPVTLTKISYRIISRIFCALVHQRKLWDNL